MIPKALSRCLTRLELLATFVCLLRLTQDAHGRGIPKNQRGIWNTVAEKQVGTSSEFVKRSLLKECYRGITPVEESRTEENALLVSDIKPLAHKPNIEISKNTLNTENVKGVNENGRFNRKLLSWLACGADSCKYNLEDFDKPFMARDRFMSRIKKHRNKKQVIKPTYAHQLGAVEKDFSVNSNVDKEYFQRHDRIFSSKGTSPSSRSTTSEEENDDETFSFHPDGGRSLRLEEQRSPSPFLTHVGAI
ncbi:uncharacterized protein MELLADRAFT_65935 [Melampsora larici-populina 98AG31]|uniref:Secreted protein n=1 Tax=Melampsora larici-populina (strain 98AG31 / pathotype 3-4-7) TaxID=747676 RepID=F4RXA1_MELLP|nr:uncharacterized protein MELLADRAFT_65935 [Melampsora larici-populina 98AG31]EGG02929.1 secreted protein [Melampsora larici-populina 98AG31]